VMKTLVGEASSLGEGPSVGEDQEATDAHQAVASFANLVVL
jgi:hypothetical protein